MVPERGRLVNKCPASSLDGPGPLSAAETLRPLRAGVWRGEASPASRLPCPPQKAGQSVRASVPQTQSLRVVQVMRLTHRNPG